MDEPVSNWAQPAHQIPRPKLSVFVIDRESASDFALLKHSLELTVLESNLAIGAQYDDDMLLGQLLSAINVARSFMHDPKPYTWVLKVLQVGMGSRWYQQSPLFFNRIRSL